jgi:hypothetical protein
MIDAQTPVALGVLAKIVPERVDATPVTMDF